jgi:hypothetical protein
MTTRSISSLIGLMLLGVSIASTATAKDRKTFPGVLCQPETQTQRISRHSRGAAMTNTGTTTQLWLCPIVRDDANRDALVSAQLVSTFSVSCTLFSRTKTAVLVEGKLPVRPPTLENGYWVWQYGAVSSEVDGFYVFRCSVPPGEQVVSYLIEEYWTDPENIVG